MKITNLLLTLLFLLFAYFQWNDPDPFEWIAIYLSVAIVSGFATFGKYSKRINLIGGAICLIWMVTLVPGVIDWIKDGMPSITGTMKAETPHIEYMREFLGLSIILAAFTFHYYQARKLKL